MLAHVKYNLEPAHKNGRYCTLDVMGGVCVALPQAFICMVVCWLFCVIGVSVHRIFRGFAY